ncbi:integral peroxisomal membrane peroxin-domain-containing protein [Cristinia sonorae]|uniref:Integral peroxisomal membrane peroxin-domain-containing protein n=1 Tax=Cristinia sonorae TaxID=1940300 RepID=A0A8K0XSY3_9AGAR|nr:integral peroxisomal membrane peroxin-domain-containing protein [Cristinia sonorae]
MATLDYIDIPSAAIRLSSYEPKQIRIAPKILTSLPNPSIVSHGLPSPHTGSGNPISPTKTGMNFQQMLLSSALPVPAGTSSPRSKGTSAPKLLSTKDPLSLSITTANFKQFVTKSGPVFWLQDRVEEIITWKCGWKYTSVWIAVYAFLCYFPRLVFVLPFVILASIILATDPSLKHPGPINESGDDESTLPPPPLQPSEGSVDWLANLQGIQNLMGLVGETHDMILPLVPHLNHTSPYTSLIFTATLVSLLCLLPLVNLLPLRATFLISGLTSFALTHPISQEHILPALALTMEPYSKHTRARLARFIDDDRLEDKHWRAEMKEVELWENERWSPPSTDPDGYALNLGWNKSNLKPGERRAWTRGRDGVTAVAEDGSGDVSNLTFSLAPGWTFVETEDWRPDLEGTWISNIGADKCGWVYTNDSWQYPRSAPLDEWKSSSGMTRRRRWVRRIYYHPM